MAIISSYSKEVQEWIFSKQAFIVAAAQLGQGSGKKAKGLVSFFMPLIPYIPPAGGWHRQLGFYRLSGLRTIKDAWVHSKLSNNFIQLCEYPCIYIVGVFNPVILHPNVFPSGKVSLSLIDKNKGWKPQITTKEVHCDLKVEDKYSLW